MRATSTMTGLMRELDTMVGDRTLSALARRCVSTPAGVKRTLLALEDRGWATEHLNGTYSLTADGRAALNAEDERFYAAVGL